MGNKLPTKKPTCTLLVSSLLLDFTSRHPTAKVFHLDPLCTPLPVTDCGTPPKIKPVTATPVSPATPATKKSAHTVPTHSTLVVKITTNRHPWIPLLPTTPKLPKLKL